MSDRAGMKHRDFKPCLLCGKGVMHAGGPTFFRMRLERFMVDLGALRRANGLEQMMGGNALLANVMGPDEDLAKRIDEEAKDVLICEPCALDPDAMSVLFQIYEKIGGA